MIYQVSKDVKLAILDSEGLVLHLKKHTYYYVNETGNYILKALAIASESGGGVRQEGLQQIIGALFDDPEGRIAEDLEAFLNKLQKEGIIQTAKEETFLPVQAIMYPKVERARYNPPTIVKNPDEIITTPSIIICRYIWKLWSP